MKLGADPLDILIREEGRTCKGCVHLEQAWKQQFCMIGMKKEKRELSRCKRYNTGEAK